MSIPAGDTLAVPGAEGVPGDAGSGGIQPLVLQFTGSTTEYFRIWIVNICLTLLTFGIFSAWAKVRKKRYFYSHTLLDGTPFQYLGQPIPILKGRLIAAALFFAWYVATHYVTTLIPAVLIVAAILAPWVIVRSAAFNARYSAFRNMTFHFSGSYGGAAKVLYGWALLTVLTAGIGFSWWQQRIKRFMVTHFGFGGVSGEFSATGGVYFKTYLIGGLMFIGSMIVLGIMMSIVIGAAGGFGSKAGIGAIVPMTVLFYALYAVVAAYVHARLTNTVWNHTHLGLVKFRSTIGARGILWIYISNTVAILTSVGLLIPWATIRLIRYRLENFSVHTEGEGLREFKGNALSAVQAAGAEVGEFFDFDMSV